MTQRSAARPVRSGTTLILSSDRTESSDEIKLVISSSEMATSVFIVFQGPGGDGGVCSWLQVPPSRGTHKQGPSHLT